MEDLYLIEQQIKQAFGHHLSKQEIEEYYKYYHHVFETQQEHCPDSE